ncbi:uncharacterized protein CLUP02_13630 [Colletotrichum lupini]|uniref:Uncharacterized protein n=1 Tax=Colletotrichum lupini TaxID=145971 RepID=A0A9Q8T2T8_9PEZI|nr:uncharacterized protein CLUP02_13630 [Colletotrichum lupini]UQC88108.1 hypothetical protein CLUP02_13630 [Colletotrichum lupini]
MAPQPSGGGPCLVSERLPSASPAAGRSFRLHLCKAVSVEAAGPNKSTSTSASSTSSLDVHPRCQCTPRARQPTQSTVEAFQPVSTPPSIGTTATAYLSNGYVSHSSFHGETRLEPAARLVDVPAPARPPHHRSPARHDAEPLNPPRRHAGSKAHGRPLTKVRKGRHTIRGGPEKPTAQSNLSPGRPICFSLLSSARLGRCQHILVVTSSIQNRVLHTSTVPSTPPEQVIGSTSSSLALGIVCVTDLSDLSKCCADGTRYQIFVFSSHGRIFGCLANGSGPAWHVTFIGMMIGSLKPPVGECGDARASNCVLPIPSPWGFVLASLVPAHEHTFKGLKDLLACSHAKLSSGPTWMNIGCVADRSTSEMSVRTPPIWPTQLSDDMGSARSQDGIFEILLEKYGTSQTFGREGPIPVSRNCSKKVQLAVLLCSAVYVVSRQLVLIAAFHSSAALPFALTRIDLEVGPGLRAWAANGHQAVSGRSVFCDIDRIASRQETDTGTSSYGKLDAGHEKVVSKCIPSRLEDLNRVLVFENAMHDYHLGDLQQWSPPSIKVHICRVAERGHIRPLFSLTLVFGSTQDVLARRRPFFWLRFESKVVSWLLILPSEDVFPTKIHHPSQAAVIYRNSGRTDLVMDLVVNIPILVLEVDGLKRRKASEAGGHDVETATPHIVSKYSDCRKREQVDQTYLTQGHIPVQAHWWITAARRTVGSRHLGGKVEVLREAGAAQFGKNFMLLPQCDNLETLSDVHRSPISNKTSSSYHLPTHNANACNAFHNTSFFHVKSQDTTVHEYCPPRTTEKLEYINQPVKSHENFGEEEVCMRAYASEGAAAETPIGRHVIVATYKTERDKIVKSINHHNTFHSFMSSPSTWTYDSATPDTSNARQAMRRSNQTTPTFVSSNSAKRGNEQARIKSPLCLAFGTRSMSSYQSHESHCGVGQHEPAESDGTAQVVSPLTDYLTFTQSSRSPRTQTKPGGNGNVSGAGALATGPRLMFPPWSKVRLYQYVLYVYVVYSVFSLT